MTLQEFNHNRFAYGDTAIIPLDGKEHMIIAVDFSSALIGFKIDPAAPDAITWFKYDEVRLVPYSK
jgi:hypothetical protein